MRFRCRGCQRLGLKKPIHEGIDARSVRRHAQVNCVSSGGVGSGKDVPWAKADCAGPRFHDVFSEAMFAFQVLNLFIGSSAFPESTPPVYLQDLYP